MNNPIRLEDEYSYTLHQLGSTSTLPPEPENEVLALLHQAIFDVTGERVEPPAKPRMGFLP